MTDPHTQEQTQNPQQEPVRAVAAPKTTATSVIYGTGPGLVATDGFHPTPTDDGHQVLVWLTPTPQERQLIAAARWGEPLPGVQTNHATPPPVLPHDETEPVQVVYHTGHPGTEASKHPAEFARQLSRQYEALSYLTVDEYLKGRDLYNTQKRAPTPTSLELQRADLEGQIVDRLVDDYRFDPDEAEKKAVEAVQALAALHEPDQSLQGTHQLVAGEIVWGNSSVNSSIGGQHKAGLARLDEKAREAQKAGKGHHYLNVRVVLCDSPQLAFRIRRGKTNIIFDPEEHKKQVSHRTRADSNALAEEINNQYPELAQPPTTPEQQEKQPPTTQEQQTQQEKEFAARYPGFANLPAAGQQYLREKNSTTQTRQTQQEKQPALGQQTQQEKQPTQTQQTQKEKQPVTPKQQEKELAARYPGFAQLPPAVQQCLREKNSTTHQPTTPHQHTPTHKPTNQKKPTR